MDDELARRMAALDDAEQLLSSCNVRGIVADYRTQMDINRMILDEARTRLAKVFEETGADGACPVEA